MGEVELLDQLLVRAGLVQRVEVLTVQVLDQRLFQAHGVVGLVNERRYRLKSCSPGGAEATFAGDQLVLFRPDLSHQNRLKNTNRLDRVDESGQTLLTELVTGLERVRADPGERHLAEHGAAGDAGVGGMSAPSPLPRPLRRTTADLLRELSVGNGAS